MRIDMGNFGNAQRAAVDTRVDRGNPAEMAEAKINTARSSARLQGMAAQAWDNLGGQMKQVGDQMYQQLRQLAAQKSALAIQQKQLYAQGILQEASDQVDTGKLKSADVHKFVSDSMAKFTYEDIDDLDEAGRMQLDRGLQSVDKSISNDTNHLYKTAHKVETRATTDEMIANQERLALNSGADLDKAAALYDSEGFQAQAREAYGAQYGKVITDAKASIYAAGAKKQLLDSRDSYGGLQALEKQFQEGGAFHGKMSADQELAIMGQIDSRKGTLEAQAAAAQARAAAAEQRAATQQMARENHAAAAQLHMREFIAAGNVPDSAMLEQYAQDTAGTSLQKDAVQMAHLATATQDFSKQPLQAQEAQLQATAARMKKGTNEADVKVFKAMQSAYETQKKQLTDDPITAVATRAGVDIPPLDTTLLKNAATPAEQKAANQQFAAQVYKRMALNEQARQQTADAPKVILTAQERRDWKGYADSLDPQTRTDFYTSLANGGGRFGIDLVKEVSGSDVMASAAYHHAANPNSTTGAYIARGQTMLDDKKSGYKPPPPAKTQTAIDDMLAGAVPAAQRSTVAASVNAHYVALRTEKGQDPHELDNDDYQESIRQVVGDVVQYGDGKVVVPAGTDANQFRNQLYQTVMQLPDGQNSMALIESGQARLQAVGAKSYMLTTPSGATYFDPKTGEPVRVSLP